jgi:hypothetical protein
VSHFAMLEEPEQVGSAIEEFVSHALARPA